MSGKKFIFITSIIFLIFLPFLVGAITPGTIPGAKELGTPESPIKTSGGLLDTIASIVKWVYIVFFIVAVLFILIAAFNYLTGGGQPEKIKLAHTQLMYALIAIAIALMSVGAVTIIKNFLSPTSEGEGGGVPSEQLPTCGPGVQSPCEMPEQPPAISI